MSLVCARPDLQERLLAALPRGSAEHALADHIDACPACRRAVALQAKMVRTWRAQRPSDGEISAAYRRFVARRDASAAPRTSRLRFALAVAALAIAAVVALRAVRQNPVAVAPIADEYGSKALGPVPAASADTPRLLIEEEREREPPPKPEPSPRTEPVPKRGSPAVTGAPAPTAAPSDAPAPPPASERPSEAEANEAWNRAADALKRNDFDKADRALSDLNRSTDPKTSEASRLARAELWIAHGKPAAVRPLLEDLAANGSSEFVRRRAAELLRGAAPTTP